MKLWKNKSQRYLSMLLVVVFCLSLVTFTPYAAEGHTHNEDGWTCIQADPIKELDCHHEHTEACYIEAATSAAHNEAQPPEDDGGSGNRFLNCPHEHTDECYTVTDGEWECTAPQKGSDVVLEFMGAVDEVSSFGEVTEENAQEYAFLYETALAAYEAVLDAGLEKSEDVCAALTRLMGGIDNDDGGDEQEVRVLTTADEQNDSPKTGLITSAWSRFYAPQDPGLGSNRYNCVAGNMAETGYGKVVLENEGDFAIDSFVPYFYGNHYTGYPYGYNSNLTSQIHYSNPGVATAEVTWDDTGRLNIKIIKGSESGVTNIEIWYNVTMLHVTSGIATDSDTASAVSGSLIYTVGNPSSMGMDPLEYWVTIDLNSNVEQPIQWQEPSDEWSEISGGEMCHIVAIDTGLFDKYRGGSHYYEFNFGGTPYDPIIDVPTNLTITSTENPDPNIAMVTASMIDVNGNDTTSSSNAKGVRFYVSGNKEGSVDVSVVGKYDYKKEVYGYGPDRDMFYGAGYSQTWWGFDDSNEEHSYTIHVTVIDTTNGRDITVTYHDGDIIAGEGGKAGDQFTIRDALASRDDLVFVGWSETSDGTVKYIPGQKPVFNEDTDLFAVWREDSGTITEFSKQLVGTKDEIPSTVTAAGIAFPGTDGVVTIPNGGSVTLLYKITVIGTAGLDYEVTDTGAVHIGGDDLKGTVPVDGTAVIYVTRTFKAGNIDDNGNVKNTASVTPGKGAEETTSSTVITPAMEAPPITYNYALTYDGNKPDSTTGTVTNVPAAQTEKTATESWETSITDAVPELEGYTFKGWSESASGEKDYEAGDKVTLTASSPEKNLYAVWEKNEPVDDPSLGVTKTVDKEKPSVGERFVYTTEVTNPEDEDIVVTIVDALDDALIFQTASDNGTYDEGTHTVTWNDVTIPKEGSATVSLVVKAKSIGEIYDETKVYRDGKPTSAGATVNPTDPQLVATKSNNNVKVNQETGEATVDYTVTVTNTSGHSLYGLRLTDVLDEPTVIKLNEASTGTPSVKVTFDNFMVRKADMYTFQPMETMEGGMDELSHTLQLLDRDEEFLNSQTVTLTYTVKIKNLSEDVAVKVYLYNTATGASWSKEPSEISGATYSMRGPARATALSSLFAAPLNSYDEPDVFSAASSDTYDGDKAPNVEVNLKQMHEVSYRWTGLPDGATAQLPAGLKCFEGTQVSVDATFASGMELEINGKTYVFSGWDKSDFTMPNDNIIITGTWAEKGANAPSGSTSSSSTPKTKYTVKWLDTEGNLLKSEIRGPVRVGAIVSATDEDMIYPGYVLFTNGGNDRPTAKAERNNRTELVLVFTKEQPEPLEPEFTVTVNYIFTDGTKAHPEQVVSGLKADSDYSIASPFLEGFSPDLLVVSGKIDGADVSIIVTYTAESTNKPSDETLPSDTPSEDHPENEPPISGDEPNGEDEPVQTSPSAIDSPQMDNTPRTGDNSHTHLWTGLCATSLIGIVLLLRKKSVTDK